MRLVRFVHVLPPSLDMLTTPPSVPVYYKQCFLGDSARARIVESATMSSLRAVVVSAVFGPIVTMSLRVAFVVRSGLIAVQVSPRFVDLNTRFAPTSSTPGSFGERIIGVSHWKRKAGSSFGGVGKTFAVVG